MNGAPARFSPEELPLDGRGVNAAAIGASLAVARELDALVAAPVPDPTPGFASRVMAAIATEPVPQPLTVFTAALVHGRLTGMLAALRDAWRVSTSAGRPAPVRAQAFALVLLVVLTVGSVAGMAGAAAGLFDSRPPDGSPFPTAPALVLPEPSTEPTDKVAPTPTADPSSPEATTPAPSRKPTVTARPTTRATQRPTATPRRTATPEPTGTDDSGGGHGGDDGESPSPSDSPSADNSGPGSATSGGD
jgi:hypothetical protein